MLRLKAKIWVQAYIRRCFSEDVPAVVVYRGDEDAGAIFLKINHLNGCADIYGPAPQGFDDAAFERRWCLNFGGEGQSEADADHYVSRQRDMDPDLWLVEVEDREGRHFLGEEFQASDRR